MQIPAPRSRRALLRRWLTAGKQRWHQLLMLRDTPHRVAMGVAIGIFIGWLPLVGIQMIIAGAIAWLVRANFLASLPGVWISNPATMVPMYYLCNRVGAFFAGDALTWQRIEEHWQQLRELGIIDAFGYLFEELGSAFVAMLIGGTLIGLALSIPTYFGVLAAINRYQRQIDTRRKRWRKILADALASLTSRRKRSRSATADPSSDTSADHQQTHESRGSATDPEPNRPAD